MEHDAEPLFLILGTIDDPHVSRVAQRTRERGIQTVVLDHNERSAVSIAQGEEGETHFAVDGCAFNAVKHDLLIWNRQKLSSSIPFFFPRRNESADAPAQSRLPERYLSYLAVEWRATYRVFLAMFEKQTLNDPVAAGRVGNKLAQQHHAAAVGLRVPASLVTNDRARASTFLNNNDCIIKGLGNARIQPDPHDEGDVSINLMTMVVTIDQVNAVTDEQFRLVPSFVQRNIRKDHELRIVFVDGEMFAFRVGSQTMRLTETDWRYGNAFLPFDPVDLPQGLSNRLSSFMRRCGLVLGSIDVIVDTQGDYWFLEVNQDGAWAWLDDKVDGLISDCFAKTFCYRVSGRSGA